MLPCHPFFLPSLCHLGSLLIVLSCMIPDHAGFLINCSNYVAFFLNSLLFVVLFFVLSLNLQYKCDQGSNSIESALLQCKNLDEIEVELKCMNTGTFQLVDILVKSLVELKATHPRLSLCCVWSTNPFSTELHQLCLYMVRGKHVLTSFCGNKFTVRSK